MKKILSATCAMMLASAGMMANAQQLPNGNFDGTWVDCKPDGSNVVGVQPVGWMASSVYKNFIMEVTGELVYQDKNREQSVGNAFSVRMENLWVGVTWFNMGANAPGYITLGTSWAYGDVSNVGKPNDTSDGGSQVGGIIGASSGTGFLLKDGRFVTARHCVEPWLFGGDIELNVMNESYDNVTVWSEIKAYGVKNDDFTLRSSDFTIDRSMDVMLNAGTDDYGNPMKMRLAYYYEYTDPETGEVTKYGDIRMGGTDWAVARTAKRGTIEGDANLSASLTQGTEVHVLGFPAGLGAGDGQSRIEPIYNKMNVARNGLNRQGCIMVSQGVAHGNSGGPVFSVKDGRIYAVAIVSKLESATQQYNDSGTAITQQQQQYDQLVPIRNIR